MSLLERVEAAKHGTAARDLGTTAAVAQPSAQPPVEPPEQPLRLSSREIARREITLPMYPALGTERVERVVKALREVLETD